MTRRGPVASLPCLPEVQAGCGEMRAPADDAGEGTGCRASGGHSLGTRDCGSKRALPLGRRGLRNPSSCSIAASTPSSPVSCVCGAMWCQSSSQRMKTCAVTGSTDFAQRAEREPMDALQDAGARTTLLRAARRLRLFGYARKTPRIARPCISMASMACRMERGCRCVSAARCAAEVVGPRIAASLA